MASSERTTLRRSAARLGEPRVAEGRPALRTSGPGDHLVSTAGVPGHSGSLLTHEIVAAYRAQAQIERAFRQMKDPDLVAFMPMWHWTDQKIRVHAFCCVMALLLLRVLRLEGRRLGVDLDPPALMDKLRGVRECTLLYPAKGPGRPRVVRTLTARDTEQERLVDGLGLYDLAP